MTSILQVNRDLARQGERIAESTGALTVAIHTGSRAMGAGSAFRFFRNLYGSPQPADLVIDLIAMVLAASVYMANKPHLNQWNRQQLNDVESRATLLDGRVQRISDCQGKFILLADKLSTVICAIGMLSLLEAAFTTPQHSAALICTDLLTILAAAVLQVANRPWMYRLNQQQLDDRRLSEMPNRRATVV